MTAINVVLKRDRAVMMTDASMYLPSGLILGFGQKAFALPTLGAAIACRGGQMQSAILAAELPMRAPSFDALLARGAEGFADTVRPILDAYGSLFSWTDLQVVLVGYSHDAQRSRGFVFDTTEDAAEEIDEYGFGPMCSDEEDANLHRLGCEMDVDISPATFDPIRHGIPIMEAQRRMKIPASGIVGVEELHTVGGHILLTEVGRDGVSQRVVHRWADEAGENIEPDAFAAPQLSRQQRRAAERMARA